MDNIVKLFILFVLGVVVGGELKRPITRTVQTNYGKVRGLYQTSDLIEKSFYSFRGIPYAKPPINELRFKVRRFLFFASYLLFCCLKLIIEAFNTRHLSRLSHGIQMLSMRTIIETLACSRTHLR